MFSAFNIPDKLTLPEELTDLLKQSWNKRYPDLYDESHHTADGVDADVMEVMQNIVVQLRAKDESLYEKRTLALAISLCRSSLSMLKGYLSESDMKSAQEFYDIAEHVLEGGSLSTELPKLPLMETVPGAAGEALGLFYDLGKIMNSEDVDCAILDILEESIVGSAICPGSSDKRAIFNWILIDVIPNAFHMQNADFVYSVETVLPDGWTFRKMKISIAS